MRNLLLLLLLLGTGSSLQADDLTDLLVGRLEFDELPPLEDGPFSELPGEPVMLGGLQITPLSVQWMKDSPAPNQIFASRQTVPPARLATPDVVTPVGFEMAETPFSTVHDAAFEQPLTDDRLPSSDMMQDDILPTSLQYDAMDVALDELHYGRNCPPVYLSLIHI